MFKDKKVIVVMPAYNAAQTLRLTYDEVMAQGIVDLVILVDDGSRDETVSIAKTFTILSCTRMKGIRAMAPIKKHVTSWH